MPTRKWKAPCNHCKGGFQHPCMFCGWKIAPRKKVSEMNNTELAELNGLRNRRQFMMDLDASTTKSGNHTTEDQRADKFLMEHRAWALELLHRHESGETIKDIADSELMTQSFCQKLIRMTGDKLIRGQFKIGLNPPTPANIIKENPFDRRQKRSVPKIKWEEEEVELAGPSNTLRPGNANHR